jgi:type III secretion protein S
MDPILTQLTYKAMMMVLYLSLPPIVVAALVGVLVGLVQALTQVQDQTISFAFKMLAVILAIMITVKWMGGQILLFTLSIFDHIPTLIK